MKLKPISATLNEALAQGWQEAHDHFCDFGPGAHPAYHEPNPYRG